MARGPSKQSGGQLSLGGITGAVSGAVSSATSTVSGAASTATSVGSSALSGVSSVGTSSLGAAVTAVASGQSLSEASAAAKAAALAAAKKKAADEAVDRAAQKIPEGSFLVRFSRALGFDSFAILSWAIAIKDFFMVTIPDSFIPPQTTFKMIIMGLVIIAALIFIVSIGIAIRIAMMGGSTFEQAKVEQQDRLVDIASSFTAMRSSSDTISRMVEGFQEGGLTLGAVDVSENPLLAMDLCENILPVSSPVMPAVAPPTTSVVAPPAPPRESSAQPSFLQKAIDEASSLLFNNDRTLVNLQPLTIKQAGFIGPIEGGLFSNDQGIIQALRAGVRSFVLQIDFLDSVKDTTKFPGLGIPTLLYYDSTGALNSQNSGSIDQIIKTIAESSFNTEVTNQKEPVLLILQFRRTPNMIRNPDMQLEYLSTVASALGPLAPYHLGMTPVGDFHRQKLEQQLVTSPIESFEKKIIVMTNVDTSMFRNAKALGLKAQKPSQDLDYWTNLRLQKVSESESLGATQIAETGKTPQGILYSQDSLLSKSEEERTALALKGKRAFTITLPPMGRNPTSDEMQIVMNEIAINSIPLELFGSELNSVQSLVQRFWTTPGWNLKPAALRNVNSKVSA